MPIYEYKGKLYELSTDDSAEAKKKIKAHLGEDEGTSLLDKGISFFGGVAKPSLGVGRSAGIVDKEAYERFLENYTPYEQRNPISSTLGQAVGVVGPVAGITAGAAATGPVAAAAAPFVGGASLGMFMGAPRYAELQARGVDKETAGLAAGDMATMGELAGPAAISGVGNMARRALTGGAINTLQGGLTTGGQNQILSKYPKEQQDYMTPQGAGMDFAIGAGLGAVLGPRGGTPMKGFGRNTDVPGKPVEAQPINTKADIDVNAGTAR